MGEEIAIADKAFELDKMVDACKLQLGKNFLIMGKVLREIRDGGYSGALVGDTEDTPTSFEAYLASKRIGHAGYSWIKIYEVFVEKYGVEEEKLADIGWGALAKLLPIVNDENRDKWIEKAGALSLSDLDTEMKSEMIKERQEKLVSEASNRLEVKTDGRENLQVEKVETIQGLNDLADDSIDALVTYPPFSEDEEFSHAQDRHLDWLSGAFRVLTPLGSIFLFVNTESLPAVSGAVRQAGFTIVRDIVWTHKPRTLTQGLQKAHGTVIWAKKGQRYTYNIAEPTTDVWNIFGKAKTDHERDLPEELVLRIIEMGTDPTQKILDPFMATETISVVAKKLNRVVLSFKPEES